MSPSLAGPPKTVLCVDDERDHLILRRMLLESLGFKVLIAEDGFTALTLCKNNKVDLIVMDYLMPGMNGAECSSKIKQIKPEVPIVMFTGLLDAPKSQADEIVFKGAFEDSGRELISVIKKYLDFPPVACGNS